jgi:predicted TIM-barrel fold metal-dependent hydrolase
MEAGSRKLIDWHMHVWRSEHLGPEWGGQLQARYKEPVGDLATFERVDAAREEAGIEAAVMIALKSRLLNMDIPNEFIAEYVRTRPDTTVGIASVDPNDVTAVDELRYAINTLGLQGLKLSPPYQGFHPHSPEAWRVFQAADDLGLPITFHQGSVFTRRGVLEYANPVLLDKVARTFSNIRIVVAHVGQPWYAEVVAMMYKHDNMFADISARFHRPWQLHNILLAARDYRVADRILFGSDFPVLTPAFCVSQLRRLNELNEGRLPTLPAEFIDELLYERPLSLVGYTLPSAAAAGTAGTAQNG